MTIDQRRTEVERTWRLLITVIEGSDTLEAEELRRLFFGTALSPEESVSSLRRMLRPNG